MLRIPAEIIETTCTDQIKAYLRDSATLLQSLSYLGLAADQQERLVNQAREYADKWDQLAPYQLIRHLERIGTRIELDRNAINIHIQLSARCCQVKRNQGHFVPQMARRRTKNQKLKVSPVTVLHTVKLTMGAQI